MASVELYNPAIRCFCGIRLIARWPAYVFQVVLRRMKIFVVVAVDLGGLFFEESDFASKATSGFQSWLYYISVGGKSSCVHIFLYRSLSFNCAYRGI